MEDQSHLFWTFLLVLFWLALLAIVGGGVAWWLYAKKRVERRRSASRAARQLARDWRDGKLPTPNPSSGQEPEPKTTRRVEKRKTWRID